jgi:hypothetical protein
MTEQPTAAAGRAFSERLTRAGLADVDSTILAIEAEAVAPWREALQRTVDMLDWTGDMAVHLPGGYSETRLAAIALLDPESPKRATALQERLAAADDDWNPDDDPDTAAARRDGYLSPLPAPHEASLDVVLLARAIHAAVHHAHASFEDDDETAADIADAYVRLASEDSAGAYR